MKIRITLLAARQEPVSLEEPSAIKIGGPTTADPAIARSALECGSSSYRLPPLIHTASAPELER
ncbi:MAG: hypothetical protein ACLQVM_29280 [Terriglobia bacterium]